MAPNNVNKAVDWSLMAKVTLECVILEHMYHLNICITFKPDVSLKTVGYCYDHPNRCLRFVTFLRLNRFQLKCNFKAAKKNRSLAHVQFYGSVEKDIIACYSMNWETLQKVWLGSALCMLWWWDKIRHREAKYYKWLAVQSWYIKESQFKTYNVSSLLPIITNSCVTKGDEPIKSAVE